MNPILRLPKTGPRPNLAKYDCDAAIYNRLRALDKDFKKTPLRAYLTQKGTAKARGISWEMNLATWWAIWDLSGKWSLRGNKSGVEYVMGRFEDVGPYSPTNVYICTNAENGRHLVCQLRKDGTRAVAERVSGVIKRQSGSRVAFRAQHKNKYLGTFDTTDAARAAYVASVLRDVP